jgi:hypothetical protein
MAKTKTKVDAIKLPDYEGTKATIIGKRIYFVTVKHDSDTSNPLEDCDGMGRIYSLSRRHISYEEGKVEQLMEEHPELCVKLSYYEHGLCKWYPAESMRALEGGHTGLVGRTIIPDLQWDNVSFAGIWYPDKALEDELKNVPDDQKRNKLIEWAGQATEEYTKWCNGEVYYYQIEVYNLRRNEDADEPYDQLSDYRYEDPLEEESCGGIVGHEYVEEAVKEALAGILQ